MRQIKQLYMCCMYAKSDNLILLCPHIKFVFNLCQSPGEKELSIHFKKQSGKISCHSPFKKRNEYAHYISIIHPHPTQHCTIPTQAYTLYLYTISYKFGEILRPVTETLPDLSYPDMTLLKIQKIIIHVCSKTQIGAMPQTA